MTDPQKPLRTALIGITGYGGTHLRSIRKLETEGLLQLKAATVINRSEAEEECAALEAAGCRIYGDYREMLDAESGKLDLCCIPTAIAWHERMTVDALHRGLHVLVEKPAAATLDEIRSMEAAANAAGRTVAVGFQDMHSETVRSAKKQWIIDRLGKVKSVDLLGIWPRTATYYARNGWAGCLKDKGHWVLDSPANNAMAHYVMLALFFAGKTAESAARVTSMEGGLYRAQSIESFDTLSVRAKTDTDVILTANLTHCEETTRNPVIFLQAEHGTMEYRMPGEITLEIGGETEMIRSPENLDSKIHMFRQVIERIHGGGGEICTLAMAREHTRWINALHEFISVRNVPDACIDVVETEKGQQTVIRDIGTSMENAFRKHSLLAEEGVSWAEPVEKADLAGYDRFAGVKK